MPAQIGMGAQPGPGAPRTVGLVQLAGLEGTRPPGALRPRRLRSAGATRGPVRSPRRRSTRQHRPPAAPRSCAPNTCTHAIRHCCKWHLSGRTYLSTDPTSIERYSLARLPGRPERRREGVRLRAQGNEAGGRHGQVQPRLRGSSGRAGADRRGDRGAGPRRAGRSLDRPLEVGVAHPGGVHAEGRPRDVGSDGVRARAGGHHDVRRRQVHPDPRRQRDHDVLPSQLRCVQRHDRRRPAPLAADRWRRAGHRAVTGRARHLHRRRLPLHRWDRGTGDRALRPHDQRARHGPSCPASTVGSPTPRSSGRG